MAELVSVADSSGPAGSTSQEVLGEQPSPFTIQYRDYVDESNLPDIQALVSKDLSEPYSIFTYRYFLHNWPQLCICVYSVNNETQSSEMIGTIICKADYEYGGGGGGNSHVDGGNGGIMRGYIAMLTVNKSYRNKGIGSSLAQLGIQRMINYGCQDILLETEVSNKGAISLYEKLGFLREERLARYYLNGGDAYRLRLSIPLHLLPFSSAATESKEDISIHPESQQAIEQKS